MRTGCLCVFALLSVVLFAFVQESDAQYTGNVVSYRTWRYSTCWRCICRYGWGCSLWRPFRCTEWYWANRCARGWTHSGNRACTIPICRPRCANGGTCVNPNVCSCPTGVAGSFCQTLLCAYERPCYPGYCYNNNQCNCTQGFDKKSGEYGCLEMEESEKPVIGRSTMVIEYTRRTDNKLIYYFLVDGTDDTLELTVWSNQKRFNFLSYQFEATYGEPEDMPERPAYVHSVELGIVKATVKVVARFYDDSFKQDYDLTCDGVTESNPNQDVFNCSISDVDYITIAEHGESMTSTFTAYSGGYRKMLTNGQFGPVEYFTQQSDSKKVIFKFDFIAPRHCSENDAYSVCTAESTPLTVENEFTKGPIELRWNGWADEEYGAGMWLYYFEVHKLTNKNPVTKTLTEVDPRGTFSSENPGLNPNVQSFNVSANDPAETTVSVSEPGMYSILMEARDIANNSRWTRRLVLFDDTSSITLNTDGGKMFYVSSANEGTNYTWQTAVDGAETTFVVNWANHFRNLFHEDNLLLNAVDPFPAQFAELEDDGILSTRKYVSDFLDDNEGSRTMEAIMHKHGIVKFEYVTITTRAQEEPTEGWQEVSPLAETVTFTEMLVNGAEVRVWVRAHDIMGNMKADFTTVRVDSTEPKLENVNDTTFTLNFEDGTYLHTSRIECDAQDPESGVYEIGIDIEIVVPDSPTETFSTRVPARIDPNKDPLTDPSCVSADPNICFVKEQEIDIDNCWFMIEDRLKLEEASAIITITAYNQARLGKTLSYNVNNLTDLSGISVYSGPTNFQIVDDYDRGFRITWELPDKESCYGKANVVILIFEYQNGLPVQILDPRVVLSSAQFFDVGGLNPESKYSLQIGSVLNDDRVSSLANLEAQTQPVKKDDDFPIGVVIGAIAGVLVIIVIVVVVMVFLVRRGYIHPAERARDIKKRATTRIRKTIYGEEALRGHTNKSYSAYDNRKSEIYIYGGDDFDGPQAYHIDRDDIIFETLIKSGHFANIYKASLKKGRKSNETVVAKTLKENFTSEDDMLMKAKINFTGNMVGEHPNVLKFIGAVVDDPAMGPFILYEYCEHGPMKDYLKSQKNNITIEMQENLFRFGLDIARGMEYLASKNIVHRRLAARNILLTFLNEVKISGFGPQPINGEEEDVEKGKKERVPIKWMAPECMKSTIDATEKSDVWSYAVVLWEIFSLGDDPYGNVRGRDLPGKVKKGERLGKPEQCDDTWYGVMTRCWNITASKRPSFVDIRNELDSLFTQAPGDQDDYYIYKR